MEYKKSFSYRDRYDIVVASGKYIGAVAKIKKLAQLIYANDREADKEDCAVQALEEYELMTGNWYDPDVDTYEDIINSIL